MTIDQVVTVLRHKLRRAMLGGSIESPQLYDAMRVALAYIERNEREKSNHDNTAT